MKHKHLIIYWVTTILLSVGMLSGGIAQIVQAQPTLEGILILGYPAYFVTILGAWKILGVIVILMPRFKLLKEWAYAGLFFEMSGAVFSHLATGHPLQEVIAPILFIVLIFLSWYYRPLNRKIVSSS